MCGRFSLDGRVKEIHKLLDALEPEGTDLKTGEIFPTNVVPVLEEAEGKMRPAAMAWGFPRWDGKGVIFNARSETALAKPMFRKALLRHPALVPPPAFTNGKPSRANAAKRNFCLPIPMPRSCGWRVFSTCLRKNTGQSGNASPF